MNIVPYYRVSTHHQEETGLGLEAQRLAVANFAQSADAAILDEFTEIESGTHCDRPVLLEALLRARTNKATLVVAKLDRLARSVSFTSALMESGVDFVCCDMPSATRLTIHILAAVAEDEARRTSERTKAALARLKAKGVKLGAHNPKVLAGLTRQRERKGWGASARKRVQKQRYGSIMPFITAMRLKPGTSFQAIAELLNAQGHRTSRGNEFTACAVLRILRREAELVSG